MKIHLDPRYLAIKHDLDNGADINPTVLVETYGELFSHYQLLSEIALHIEQHDELQSAALIAAFLTEFELEAFQAIDYQPLPEFSNRFTGEILYACDLLALCKVTSQKYPGFGLIILITQSFDLSLAQEGKGCLVEGNFQLSGVMQV